MQRGRSQRSGMFVTEATARSGCDVFLFGVGDHFDVCKHQSTGDVGYQCFENWLDSILKSSTKSSPNYMPKFDLTNDETYFRAFPTRDPFMDHSLGRHLRILQFSQFLQYLQYLQFHSCS